jgi:hypothetical protein
MVRIAATAIAPPHGGRGRPGLSSGGWIAVIGILSVAATGLTTSQAMLAPADPLPFLA